MLTFNTSRSRHQDFLRCPRARYWLHEAQGTGFEPVRVSVPLATGTAVHAGLAALLEGSDEESAVQAGLADYLKKCAQRDFSLDQLENQSFVFNEQRALVEALIRLAARRIVPALLTTYDILEVEQIDTVPFVSGPDYEVQWRSIPDALMLHRETNELYILSWKTTSEFSPQRDQDARIDMQGLSEPWAVEQRLESWWRELNTSESGEAPAGIPRWFVDYYKGFYAPRNPQPFPGIRGVQMVYLVKGARRELTPSSFLASGETLNQITSGAKIYRSCSPLIYGLVQDSSPGLCPPSYAWSSRYQCAAPHPMRKSKWYPSGECPGDGRNHELPGEWSNFAAWNHMTVKEWIDRLEEGNVLPSSDPLSSAWAMPMPHYRTQEAKESWARQTRCSERRIAEELSNIRPMEHLSEELLLELDISFEQDTSNCNDWFARKCPCYSICHEGAWCDPVGSGEYQLKEQYQGRGKYEDPKRDHRTATE